MADKIWYVIMVPMVYVAFAWCIVWIVIKIGEILKAPKKPPTLRIFPEGKDSEDTSSTGLAGALWDTFTMPSVLRYNPLLWFFLIVFHVAILAVILAHLDIFPQLSIMPKESEHMIGNGAIGVVLTICVLYFLFRRFVGPLREVSVAGDYLLLVLLLGIVTSGDIISWGNSWSESGFVMGKKDFGLYLDSLIRFTFADPRQFLSGAHYSVVGTHVLLANLLLFVLPFSKVMHFVFAVPLNRLRRG